jgi:hypothetical protein
MPKGLHTRWNLAGPLFPATSDLARPVARPQWLQRRPIPMEIEATLLTPAREQRQRGPVHARLHSAATALHRGRVPRAPPPRSVCPRRPGDRREHHAGVRPPPRRRDRASIRSEDRVLTLTPQSSPTRRPRTDADAHAVVGVVSPRPAGRVWSGGMPHPHRPRQPARAQTAGVCRDSRRVALAAGRPNHPLNVRGANDAARASRAPPARQNGNRTGSSPTTTAPTRTSRGSPSRVKSENRYPPGP